MLSSQFRLNPILGINGDDYEASSKFVQRMIYSPLVFPLQDPYLQDDFEYHLQLSLIEELAYSIDNRNWITIDLNNRRALTSGSGYIYFRVKLRDGLHFYQGNTSRAYDTLKVQDVVYSYRISRITMDRKFLGYINDPTRQLGINTLMYSRIRSFKNVYCRDDNSGHIFFTMDSNKTGDAFLKLLVYVPILSSKQMNNDSLKMRGVSPSPEYISLHRADLDMARLFDSGEINNREYDFYDINKILLVLDNRGNVLRTTPLGEQFFRSPVGYGQFVLRGRPTPSGRDPDLWTEVHLARNPHWSHFGSTIKIIGGERFDHNLYRNRTNGLIIKYSRGLDRGLSGESEILYNEPLSSSMFKTGELSIISLDRNKLRMQISHNLYGIFFGPDLQNTQGYMYEEVRLFLSYFADRVRLENILKYVIGNPDPDVFESEIMVEGFPDENGNLVPSLIGDLQIQSLYFPFFTALQDNNLTSLSNIGGFYDTLRNNDVLFQQYRDQLREQSISTYYRRLPLNPPSIRTDFYNRYVGGLAFDGNILANMDTSFNNARRYMTRDGQIRIEMVYKSDDSIGHRIANRYKDLLEYYFRSNGIRAVINVHNIDSYSGWRSRAISNSRSDKISLLVRGWNYKFDLLDDIHPTNQFIFREDFDAVRERYFDMIKDNDHDTENVVQRIAQEFVNRSIMIPLVGIQNYVVFNRTPKFEYFNKYRDKFEIILLPFYWDL